MTQLSPRSVSSGTGGSRKDPSHDAPISGRRRASRRRIFPAIVVLWFLWTSVPVTATNPFLCGAPHANVVFNIAHTGAASLAPQNTLAAGRLSFELGADVWGIDVQCTSDGVLVLMHDETLDRTTNVETLFPSRAPWQVEAFTLDEIRRLDAGSWFVQNDPFGQIELGFVSPDELHSYVDEPVPTLREALAFVSEQGWLVDIEIKSSGVHCARELLDLIEETETFERVMVSSFDHEFLREIKTLAPALPIGALSIFMPTDPVAYLRQLQADIYLPSLVGFTDELLTSLSEAQIGVHVWTYNAIDQLERLACTPGITGIYTDFPQRLEAILDRPPHVEEE